MTLVQLRHLIALEESGSFTHAAEAVFLTQPAFSRSIRALEDELGHPVFDRIGRKCELTPFGREVLMRARHLVFDADELVNSGQLMRAGRAGTLRIGMGSGPGAMLMTPLLAEMAMKHPTIHLDIARGNTQMLVLALRERALDALVIDVRSLVPTPDLKVSGSSEMRGAMMCRPGHPLTRWNGPLRFAALQQYPIASTPLSDEVARVLVERYGPGAHPQACVTIRCEEIASLVDVVSRSDAILLAIRAAAPDLEELSLQPVLNSTARFGMVTLAGRTEAPALSIVRELMQARLHD